MISKTAEAAREIHEDTWPYRAIRNQLRPTGELTKLGQILVAVLGLDRGWPRYGPQCIILNDNAVPGDCSIVAEQKTGPGSGVALVRVGSVQELKDNLIGLADHLAFDQTDLEDMLGQVRLWVQ